MTEQATPPAARTHLGAAMTAATIAGKLQLQCCEQCSCVQYPPREVCCNCLSDELDWREVNPAGTVQASSELQHALEPWFQERTPWLIGSVKLDCGPLVLAHLCAEVAAPGSPVWVLSINDSSGQAVLVGAPHTLTLEQAHSQARLLFTSNKEEIQ
jgi:uncharacterized OB-fold protein